MRTPDPGRAEATDEPLLSAVTLAVGGPELKAGGEAAVQGFKALLERRAVGLGADITSENVLPQAVAAAESRAAGAAQQLATEQSGQVPTALPPGAAADHPAPVTATDHPAPATTHDPPPAGSGLHFSVPPSDAVPHPLPQDSPLFDGYHPVAPGPEFTRDDGSLIYPDDTPWPASPTPSPALLYPTRTCPKAPSSTASATPAVLTYPPTASPSLNGRFPQKAPSNPTINTSSTTPQRSHPDGTSKSPKPHRGSTNPAAALNTESSRHPGKIHRWMRWSNRVI
jgi:hypothetical protein